LDLCPLCDHGGEAVGADGLGDMADGEREAVHHGRKVGDDDHLVRLEAVRTPLPSTPLSTKYGQQST
jgi:hypothetical protein